MDDVAFAAALEVADLIHDQASIERALDRMAAELDPMLVGTRAIYVTILTGGLVAAGQLATRLSADMDFDYVHVSRYRGTTQGHAVLDWVAGPRLDWKGRDVVLVDDILDEGHTVAALIADARERGAASVRLVALCEKRHERRMPGVSADVVGLEVPDRYVFGYGMDCYERGRQLPAIYALKEG
ncbi:MAG: hypoxanthine-guanine phosphoribosyltransferase [Xanthomonadales bacterium]|nr:hypoxanthine-guanine phosphoribosyltransferase [Xanthomonadales bacterium]